MTRKTYVDSETGCTVQQHSRRAITAWLPGSGAKASTLSLVQTERTGKHVRLQIAGAADARGDTNTATVFLLTRDEAEDAINVLDALLDAVDRIERAPVQTPLRRAQGDFEGLGA